MQLTDVYQAPTGASKTLGLEVVSAAGHWRVGDKVCALVPGGGYAEYALCDPRHALLIPRGLSFEEAAGLPKTAFAVATLAWVSPGHCAPPRSAWSWADVWFDLGMDLVLLWLAAIFWVVTHVWALLVVWGEARATRAAQPSIDAEEESA